MLSRDDADRIMDATAYDPAGRKIGSVGQLYLDDASGNPAWVSTRGGLFGGKQHFVPLAGASLSGDRLVVTVSEEQVKNAPDVDLDDGKLGRTAAEQLRAYYAPATSGPLIVGSPDSDPVPGSDPVRPGAPAAESRSDAPAAGQPDPTPPPAPVPPPIQDSPAAASGGYDAPAAPAYDAPPPTQPSAAYDAPPPAQPPAAGDTPAAPSGPAYDTAQTPSAPLSPAADPHPVTPVPAAVPAPSNIEETAMTTPPPADTPAAAGGAEQEGLRLVRKVVVEEQTITVPVVREEYVLEGEPELNEARQPDVNPDPQA